MFPVLLPLTVSDTQSTSETSQLLRSRYGEPCGFLSTHRLDLFFSQVARGVGFPKRVVLANVPSLRFFVQGGTVEHAKEPSLRFSFRGNIRMYPHSGFRSGRPFGKPPFWQPPTFGLRAPARRHHQSRRARQALGSQWGNRWACGQRPG